MATKKAGSAAKKTTRSKSHSTTTVTASAKASKPRLDFRGRDLATPFIGEFVGAFALVAAFLITKGEPLYMGFVVIGLVLLVASLSGAHLNPVVTVAAWVTRRVDHLKALVYLVAQFLGAGAAFVTLSTFMSGAPEQVGSLAQPAREVFQLAALNTDTQWYVFFAEVLGASVFAFAVAGVYKASVDNVTRALTVGFGWMVSVLLASVLAGYVSAQVALNPAAAVAASAVDWSNINWMAVVVFLGAPLVGGVVGFALRDLVENK